MVKEDAKQASNDRVHCLLNAGTGRRVIFEPKPAPGECNEGDTEAGQTGSDSVPTRLHEARPSNTCPKQLLNGITAIEYSAVPESLEGYLLDKVAYRAPGEQDMPEGSAIDRDSKPVQRASLISLYVRWGDGPIGPPEDAIEEGWIWLSLNSDRIGRWRAGIYELLRTYGHATPNVILATASPRVAKLYTEIQRLPLEERQELNQISKELNQISTPEQNGRPTTSVTQRRNRLGSRREVGLRETGEPEQSDEEDKRPAGRAAMSSTRTTAGSRVDDDVTTSDDDGDSVKAREADAEPKAGDGATLKATKSRIKGGSPPNKREKIIEKIAVLSTELQEEEKKTTPSKDAQQEEEPEVGSQEKDVQEEPQPKPKRTRRSPLKYGP